MHFYFVTNFLFVVVLVLVIGADARSKAENQHIYCAYKIMKNVKIHFFCIRKLSPSKTYSFRVLFSFFDRCEKNKYVFTSVFSVWNMCFFFNGWTDVLCKAFSIRNRIQKKNLSVDQLMISDVILFNFMCYVQFPLAV